MDSPSTRQVELRLTPVRVQLQATLALPPKICFFRNPQPLPGGAGAAAGLKGWGGLWQWQHGHS